MPSWVTRKEEAASAVVAALVVNILGLLVFYTLMTLLTDSSRAINDRNEICAVCDRYLEGMMAEGYLTEEKAADLIRSLEELGAADCDLSGSTLSEAAYGEVICLQVAYDHTTKRHGLGVLLLPVISEETGQSNYCRLATSYH